EIGSNLDVRSGGSLEAATLHQADSCIGYGFGGQAMRRTGIETEHVAGQVERADLAPSVVEKLVGANRTADHLIDVFGRLTFAINLLLFPVGIFGGNHARTAGDYAELVDGRG